MPTGLISLQDPRSQYPGPPTKVEIQPAPGTETKMSEKPNCGEKSYKGSGKLPGRKALLTGANSGIGRNRYVVDTLKRPRYLRVWQITGAEIDFSGTGLRNGLPEMGSLRSRSSPGYAA